VRQDAAFEEVAKLTNHEVGKAGTVPIDLLDECLQELGEDPVKRLAFGLKPSVDRSTDLD